MQKVLDLLEKHVQWVVLGLGVLFVLYMVYGYVLTPPATVEVGSKTLTASEVDDEINQTIATNLGRELEKTDSLEMPVKPFDADFLATIENTAPEVVALNKPTSQWFPGVPDTGTGPGGVPTGPQPEVPLGNAKLAVLPPAKVAGAVVTGRSMVTKPVAPPQMNPMDPNVMNNPEAAPVAPVFNGVGPDGQPLTAAEVPPSDHDWATAFFTIPMKDLADAWRAAGIVPPAVPQGAQMTAFLEVTGEREEQTSVDAKGQPIWGNRTKLKPISTVSLLPLPDPALPPAAQLVFQEWAVTRQAEILQPPFYVVVGGDGWREPGAPVVQVGGDPNNMFNEPGMGGGEMMPPGMPGEDPNRKLTPQERRLQMQQERQRKADEARQIAEQKKAEQQMQREMRRGGGGGPPPGAMRPQVRDPNRPIGRPGAGYDPRMGGQPPYGGQNPYGGPPFGGPGGAPPFPMPGMQPGQPGQPGMLPNGIAAKPAPVGLFVPAPQAPDVAAWVHDDTVEPGKTYRYRIRYAVKNPVYNTNLAGPDVTKVFAIRQDEKQSSPWTEPATITTRTQFFVASVIQSKATLRVFRWQDGRLNAKEFTVFPGDPIGTADGDIDYSTGHTLVDIRDNGVVLLMDPEFKLRQRSFTGDERDPEHQRLRQEVANTARPADPALGGLGAAR